MASWKHRLGERWYRMGYLSQVLITCSAAGMFTTVGAYVVMSAVESCAKTRELNRVNVGLSEVAHLTVITK